MGYSPILGTWNYLSGKSLSRPHIIKATCYDKKGRRLSVAFNSYEKTHPLQEHFSSLAAKPKAIYLHAELLALLRCKDDRPYSIFVERYTRDGEAALAKPCDACMLAIKHWGVKHINFTK